MRERERARNTGLQTPGSNPPYNPLPPFLLFKTATKDTQSYS